MSDLIVPAPDCSLCPRLVDFRAANRVAYGDFHNAPVPSFGPLFAPVLIVGMAPGLKGANRTGRPFTGDKAGDLLYPTVLKFGLGQGTYGTHADDGLKLTKCRITNAVRCVPPKNIVKGAEITACNLFLRAEIQAMPHLKVLLAIGADAHKAVLKALGHKPSAFKFIHCAQHDLGGGLILADSYHCSQYNISTKLLTEAMFHDVFRALSL